jgi:hypothetical protein
MWREAFGRPDVRETPETYRPKPYSRSFVMHLPDWYAQSSPDEDFAETFAVWLTPESNWRERYRGWPALRKLECVDALMQSITGREPPHNPPIRPQDYDCLNVKLKTYYARKRKLYEESYPDFLDSDLRKLFSPPQEGAKQTKASRYLRGHRRQLMNAVNFSTHERKYRVNQLLGKLIDRCDALGLVVKSDTPALNLQVGAYVATLIMNHLFTGRFKRRSVER